MNLGGDLDMKLTQRKENRRLFLTGAVALTVGTVGLATTARADSADSSESGDEVSQIASEQSQDQQVALKPSESTGEQSKDPAETPTESETSRGSSSTGTPEKSVAKPEVESAAADSTKEEPTTSTSAPADKPKPAPQASASKAPALRMAKAEVETPPAVDDLIPDKNFQQIVLFAIQQDNPDVTAVSQITPDLLGKLTEINLNSDAAIAKQQNDQAFYNAVANAKSLAGLEYAKGLQKLIIFPNASASRKWGNTSLNGQLTDLSAIKELTGLLTLTLKYNQLTDVDTAPLAGLTNLTTIDLSHNQIKDLSFMSKMVNLINITLSYNDISDVSPLRNITATPGIFSFGNNHIFDIMPLLGLNWQPFFGDQITYMISAGNQTWTLDPVRLNSATQTLSTWSFAYDNLYDFNEFMIGDPQSAGSSRIIGAANWVTWSDLTAAPGQSGQLVLDWDVSRHNDLTRPEAPNGLTFAGKIFVPYTLQEGVDAVTVAFQLDGGVKIAPFVILNGQPGTTLDVLDDPSVQATIADLERRGFTYEKPAKYTPDLTDTTESSTVTYTDDAQNITLLFSPLQKIYLVDENGQPIGQKLVKEFGKIGTVWQVDLPKISGYTYDHVTGSGTLTDQTLSGTIQDYNDDIYVYYQSTGEPEKPPVTPVDPGTPVENGQVTVHYQDEAGVKLTDDQVLTGAVGTAYATQGLTFDKYKLTALPVNATGTFTAAVQDVYYIYHDETVKLPDKGDDQQPDTGEPTLPQIPQPQSPNATAVLAQQEDAPAILSDGLAAMVTAEPDEVATRQTTSPAQTPRQASRVTRQRLVVHSRARRVDVRPAAKTTPRPTTELPQTGDRQYSALVGAALFAAISSLAGARWFKRQ